MYKTTLEDDWPICRAPMRCAKACPLVNFGGACAGSVELAAQDLALGLTPEDSELGVPALIV
jgi:hypothetical protein